MSANRPLLPERLALRHEHADRSASAPERATSIPKENLDGPTLPGAADRSVRHHSILLSGIVAAVAGFTAGVLLRLAIVAKRRNTLLGMRHLDHLQRWHHPLLLLAPVYHDTAPANVTPLTFYTVTAGTKSSKLSTASRRFFI